MCGHLKFLIKNIKHVSAYVFANKTSEPLKANEAKWTSFETSTCDDDDGSAENVGEDEDVDVLQRVKLEAIAAGDRRRHLHNLFPLILPVLEQHKQTLLYLAWTMP